MTTKVYDLIPYFDDYVHDMESSLQMSHTDWERYQRYPGPFVLDLLLDFGEYPEGVTGDAAEEIAREAILEHYGRDALSLEAFARNEVEEETTVVLSPRYEVRLPLGDSHVVAARYNCPRAAVGHAEILNRNDLGATVYDLVCKSEI